MRSANDNNVNITTGDAGGEVGGRVALVTRDYNVITIPAFSYLAMI